MDFSNIFIFRAISVSNVMDSLTEKQLNTLKALYWCHTNIEKHDILRKYNWNEIDFDNYEDYEIIAIRHQLNLMQFFVLTTNTQTFLKNKKWDYFSIDCLTIGGLTEYRDMIVIGNKTDAMLFQLSMKNFKLITEDDVRSLVEMNKFRLEEYNSFKLFAETHFPELIAPK